VGAVVAYARRADGLDEFGEVLEGLRFGFCLGPKFELDSFFISDNHKSARDNPDIIHAYIAKEIAAGRYSEAYEPVDLGRCIGYFRTSPLERSCCQ
jgi:hypothetical protein